MLVPPQKTSPMVAFDFSHSGSFETSAQFVTVSQKFTGTTEPGWSLDGYRFYTRTLTNTPNGLTFTTSISQLRSDGPDGGPFQSVRLLCFK